MFEKLKLVQEKYEEISKKLQEPDVINNNLVYRELMKEYKNLTPVVEKFKNLKKWHKISMKNLKQNLKLFLTN